MGALSQQQAAALVGKTASYFREHVAWIPRNPDKTYDGPAVVAAFLGRKSKEAEGNSASQLKHRKLEAETKEAELKAERLDREEEEAIGNLIRRSEVAAAWRQHIALFAERMVGIADRIAPMLPANIAESLSEDIRKEIARNLTAYSEETPRSLGVGK